MSYDNINEILARYWEGNTSLEEEQLLKDYFRSDSIRSEHQKYVSLFRLFEGEESKQLSSDFDQKILNEIQAKSRVVQMKRPVASRYWWVAAASLLLVCGMFYWGGMMSNNNQWANDTYTEAEAEMALEKTKAALELMSAKMNTGYDGYNQIGKFDEAFNKVNNIKY